MTEPHYSIHEMDDGRYEIMEPGSDAPIAIRDTLEEAKAWVLKMESQSEG